jgi:hypothetical protein
MPPIEFKAPWSRSLRLVTILSTLVLVAIATSGFLAAQSLRLDWILAMIGVPLIILFAALRCMVLGYRLTEKEIQVKRLGWITALPLATLKSVEGNVDAMRGSLRLFGNGGLFSFTGFFWNRQLKLYRAFATDPSRAVVLRYQNRLVVITPHDPQHFIMRAGTLLKAAGFER